MSTQTDKVRQKKCPECKKRIDLPNFDLHLNRCIEARSQLSSSSSMNNISLQNGERAKGRQKAPHSVEYFPCHLCGYRQNMMELDTHPKVCPNKQINCPICHLNFPSNILPDHKYTCSRQYQHQRTPPMNSKPLEGTSNLAHPIVRNNQDKQLVAIKQTNLQSLFGNGNQPCNNQIDYTMNLPPVPKPQIFPHQQNFQITAQNTNNIQVNPQKKAEIKKEGEKTVNNAGLNQQKKGQTAPNNQQPKSISQKLEKSYNVEVEKKASVSQVLPNTKTQITKANQPISNTTFNPPKHINPFKSKDSAPMNPFIGHYCPPNSIFSSNGNSSKNIQPFRASTSPKQNVANTTSINPSANNNIPSKNIQNTIPNTNNPPKINQAISSNTNRINSTHPQTSTVNSMNTNQNVPRGNQPNPPVNPFKNNVASNQVVNVFAPPRNPTSSSPPTSTSNNTSSSGSSNINTSSSFSSTDSSFYAPPRRQDNTRERVPNDLPEARDLIRGINQYFNDMNLDNFRRMLENRTLIEFLSSRLSDGKSQGLADTSIRAIPEILFTTQMTKGEAESCSICFVQFQRNDRLKNLRCRHLYHSKCISDWLKINRLCPLCKADLSENIPPEYRQVSREDRLMQMYLRTVIAAFPDSDEDDDDYTGFN